MARLGDDEKCRAWLAKHAREPQDAALVFAVEVENLTLANAARVAGYSGGRSNDPDEQTRQLASAGARAMKSNRVRRLVEEFRRFKEHGDVPIAQEREVLTRLSEIVRTSTDASAIQAAKGLLDFHRRVPTTDISANRLPAIVDEACHRDDPLLQVFGIASGMFQRKAGHPGFLDWAVPEGLERIETLLSSSGLGPVDVISLLIAGGQGKKK